MGSSLKRNPDSYLEDSLSFHDGGDEDADQDEYHKGVDDVEQVGLPRRPGQNRSTDEKHVSWNGCLERKIYLPFIRAQASVKCECSSHLREGEVRREGDVHVHRL